MKNYQKINNGTLNTTQKTKNSGALEWHADPAPCDILCVAHINTNHKDKSLFGNI